jgi:hypothetical protein
MDWDRQKVKESLEILANLPDFDSLLFPEEWSKEYDIPITPAKILTLSEVLRENKKIVTFAQITEYETRGPAPGGVREVICEEPYVPETIVKTLTDTDEQPLPELEPVHQAKESNDSEQQENQALGPTGASPQSYDGGHNGHDGQGL